MLITSMPVHPPRPTSNSSIGRGPVSVPPTSGAASMTTSWPLSVIARNAMFPSRSTLTRCVLDIHFLLASNGAHGPVRDELEQATAPHAESDRYEADQRQNRASGPAQHEQSIPHQADAQCNAEKTAESAVQEVD